MKDQIVLLAQRLYVARIEARNQYFALHGQFYDTTDTTPDLLAKAVVEELSIVKDIARGIKR
jgi:hypothetical protein